MTRDDRSPSGRPKDEILAGEYVMGVLSIDARRMVERRIGEDEAFSRLVERWQSDMSSFNEDYREIAPRPAVYGEIEKRLFGAQARPLRAGLINTVGFWRFVSGALAIALVGSLFFASGLWPSIRDGDKLVADLSAPDSAVSLLASFDAADGKLRITPVATGRSQEKSLQLWLVPGTGNPRSLGVFQAGSNGEIIIPDELRDTISDGATLAVSLEPFGGSPTGLPTGPIVASGVTRRL